MRAFSRSSLSILAALALSCAIATPAARASVTGVNFGSWSASGVTPTQGSCPTTIQFQGVVLGTAGSTYTWQVTSTYNNVITTSSPASGIIAETPQGAESVGKFYFTLPISSSTVSTETNNVSAQVTTTKSGAPVVFHPPAVKFTFTCTAAPAPTAAPGPSATPGAAGPPPTNLRPVQTGADCNALPTLYPVACNNAVLAGELGLVWNDAVSPSAYDVFRVDGGQHALLGTVGSNGALGNAPPKYFTVPKGAGYTGECFTVEAVAGSSTSGDSNSYCYASGGTATIVTLKPSHMTTALQYSVPQPDPTPPGFLSRIDALACPMKVRFSKRQTRPTRASRISRRRS